MKKVLLFTMLIQVFISCSKKEPVFTDSPKIEFISIAPGNVTHLETPFTITIHYKDGDGNLGTGDPDKKNIFVIDNRIGLLYEFRLRDLSSGSGSNSIEGNLNIEMPPTAIIDDSHSSEKVDYTVFIKDEASNESNRITTTPVTIIR